MMNNQQNIIPMNDFLHQIQSLHQKGISDPALILHELIHTYFTERKEQPGGLLQGFFQQGSESIAKLCTKLLKKKDESIYDKIQIINKYLGETHSKLETGFQNLLNAFFSYYKNLAPNLTSKLKENLQLVDPYLRYLTPLTVMPLIDQLEEKDEIRQQAFFSLPHLAKLLPENTRERIATTLLKMPESIMQIEALAEMGSSIPDTLHPDLVRLIKRFISPQMLRGTSPAEFEHVSHALEKLSFTISDETLKHEIQGETERLCEENLISSSLTKLSIAKTR